MVLQRIIQHFVRSSYPDFADANHQKVGLMMVLGLGGLYVFVWIVD
jgi:hypothetical protein